MARITFTAEQLASGKLLQPGWYPLLVKSHEVTAASTDQSENYIFQLVVTDGAAKGVPIRLLANEKRPDIPPFPEFCDVLSDGGAKPGVPIDMDKFVGKNLDGYVQRGEYKGRPQNQFVSFRKKQ